MITASKEYAERVNPRRLGFDEKMGAIVGAILDYDYGIRDLKNGRLSGVFISSDGLVFCQNTASDTGALFSSAEDLEINLEIWKEDLTESDKDTFENLYASNVVDWRTGA